MITSTANAQSDEHRSPAEHGPLASMESRTLGDPPENPSLFSAAELSQRAAELEVRLEVAESERAHARQVLEALPQAVIVTDPFDDVVLVSTAAAKLFGLPDGKRHFGHVLGLVGDPVLVELVSQTRSLHSRGASRTTRRVVDTRLGRRTFDITLLCLCDQDDGRPSPWGAAVILAEIDVPALRQAAELTAAVAHELRTPLSSVHAYTEMLLDGDARDESTRREFLRIVASETQRLTRLVENMQLLARVELGEGVELHAVVDAVAVVRNAADVVAPQAVAAGVTLELPPPATSEYPPHIRGDADLLIQAAINVLANAVKYTPRGGRVRLEISTSPDTVTVLVHDSGIGIHPGELPRVFDKFFRSAHSRVVAPGSGLGLALVRQIVESVHAGRVTLQSQPGVGTTVRIELPRSSAELGSDPAATQGGNRAG